MNGKITENYVFMKLLKEDGNTRVFMYGDWSYNSGKKYVCFQIYDGEELLVEYDLLSDLY